MTKTSEHTGRNYGIDLLRILSMYMVVVLHFLNIGGIYGSEASEVARVTNLEILSLVYCCVDCFALISGFVGYRENKHKRNTVSFMILWCQVFFYSMLITFVIDISGISKVSGDSYLFSALPLTENQYWYFTAYFGVFLAEPYLNMLVDHISSRTAFAMLIGIVFFFSFMPYMSELFNFFCNGYNAVWLIMLYILGALLKKDDLYKKLCCRWKLILLLVILVEITFTIGYFKNEYRDIFSYTEPFILIEAIVLVILFANAKPGKVITKLTSFIAPAVFGVFLIHTQKKLFNLIFGIDFSFITELPSILPSLAVLAASAVLFIVCIALDIIRIKLFELIRLKKAAEAVYSVLHDKYIGVLTKLSVKLDIK